MSVELQQIIALVIALWVLGKVISVIDQDADYSTPVLVILFFLGLIPWVLIIAIAIKIAIFVF